MSFARKTSLQGVQQVKRVVVCLDKIRGALSAIDASTALAQAIRLVLPASVAVEVVPVCDGGDGLLETVEALGGERISDIVSCDAAGRPIDDARVVVTRDGAGRSVCVVQSADTLGYARLDAAGSAHPRIIDRTSFGLGLVLKAAMALGVDSIIVGLGDSAVNDFGAGMLRALGARFLDTTGAEIEGTMRTIDLTRARRIALAPLSHPPIRLACNLSSTARSCVGRYAGQKGGSDEDKRILGEIGAHVMGLYHDAFGTTSLETVPGGGGSGGIGIALISALGATPVYSFRVIHDVVGLRQRLEDADVVIVGEGRLDDSSLSGKPAAATAILARSLGARVFAVAGALAPGCYGRLRALGIEDVYTLSNPQQELGAYLRETRGLLGEVGMRLGVRLLGA